MVPIPVRITHRSSVLKGRSSVHNEPVIRLGRDLDCHVLFDEQADRAVSRRHLELRWDADRLFAAPAPGKIVLRNGQPIEQPTELRSGDLLELSGAGGPSVEISFDATMDDASGVKTELGVPVFIPSAPTDAAAPIRPRAPDPAPAPAPALAPALSPVPDEPPEHVRTAILAALPEPAAPITQILPKLDPIDDDEEPRRWWPVIVGVVLVLIVAGVGYFLLRHHPRVRAVIDPAALDAYLDNSSKLALFEFEAPTPAAKPEEKAAKTPTPAPAAEPEPVAEPKPQPSGPSAAELAQQKAEEERKRIAAEQEAERAAIRELFAAIKRTELERLAGAPGADLATRRKAAQAAYEEALSRKPAPAGVDATIHKVIRYLGECDGAVPGRFTAATKAAITRYRNDPEAKERLTSAIKLADEKRFGPTITAALGDQRVPVELFFIPYAQSAFDDQKVGAAAAGGIPKGLWQLSPGAAQRFGLKVGAAAGSAEVDPADDRHRPEKEAKAVAKAMRALYQGAAGGSALLILATYDHGDDSRLKAARAKAGLDEADKDPGKVSLWKLIDAGAIGDEALKAAADAFAAICIGTDPAAFGFSFAPPVKHVSLGD